MGPNDRASSSALAGGAAPDDPVDPLVRQCLRRAADENGFLRFDRFMEISLYEPGSGFYDRPATRLGREGDFYTAAHVHELYGATLAAHFREIRASEGSPPRFPIVEVGPGDGTLAFDVGAALDITRKDEQDWEYILVERSAKLRGAIEARLGRAPGGISWRFAPSLAAEGPLRGIVLANELLDAFPFRRFVRTKSGWAEIGVAVPEEGPLRTETQPPGWSNLPEGLPGTFPTGAGFEVSLAMEAWIREVADHLVGGRLLLIDYGTEEDALGARGETGTTGAIREHRSVDPLSRPGTADISAWVNFTRLRRAARAVGFREIFYGSLAEAMIVWGIDQVRQRLATGTDSTEAVKLQLAQKSFLVGFSSFKVLELSPGLGSV
jgi:SAM-dependent MidA family methyltransferase